MKRRWEKEGIFRVERLLDRIAGPPLLLLLAFFASRREPPDPAPPRRILMVKLHGIGNVVLILPVLRQVRRAFPGAEIGFLTFRSNQGVIEGIPEVDRGHFLDRGAPLGLVLSLVRAVAGIRGRRYDLVVDFDQFAHLSAILALLSGAPRRVGFHNPALRRHPAFTTPVSLLDDTHVSRTFSRLAEAAGAPSTPPPPRELLLGEGHLGEAERLLGEAGIRPGEPVVVLHPGSSPNVPLRRWPAERFARLGERLARECGARIVVSGTEEEAELVREVAGGMDPPPVVAAGRLSIRGFAALCRAARLVVSNDTAAVHLASAMGTPVAGLFGPNTPSLYGPLGDRDLVFYRALPCSPCLSNITSKISRCRRARCMEAIGVDEVFTAVRDRFFPAGKA